MNAITYITARAKLADSIDRVCDNHGPIIIMRKGQQMMSLYDFKSLEEASYLLRSPKRVAWTERSGSQRRSRSIRGKVAAICGRCVPSTKSFPD